jgi:phospholipid/cholesterol/gamma-HCH transport system permease protein
MILFKNRILKIVSGVKNFYNYIVSIIISFKSIKHLRFRSLLTTAINQTKFTGIDAMPLVASIAILIGGTVIIQATQNFPKFGIEGFIGNLLVLIIARELGPLITAIIVITRSGSAIAAEIATQKQHKEIMSLELMGIDTKLYIVFPRILASIFSIFSLIIIFDIAGFFGGYLLSMTTVYIPLDNFMMTVMEAFSFEDLIITLVKSIIYGILIPLISCYYGFMPNAYFEIPIDVSRAVVRTVWIIFVINALISAIFYF